MPALSAIFSLLVTLGLVVARPRIGAVFRVGPAFAAAAGVGVMLIFRVVDRADLISTMGLMWRPMIAVSAIMVTTAVAQRVGLMDWLASVVEARGRGGAGRLFGLVYILGASTAAVLNNDAAILLLTPIVVALVRRRYPTRPGLLLPFAFVVFMAAGVAPLIMSNPMNMIVAAYAGIDFNEYALRMVPIAILGWIVGYLVLRALFRRSLADAPREAAAEPPPLASTPVQRRTLALLLTVLLAYPIVAYAGGPVWVVAVGGALAALLLVWHHRAASPGRVFIEGISWEILGFLVAVSVLGVGLRHAGLVHWLSAAYGRGGMIGIGIVSALGSAVVNNHPMSILNMLAIHDLPGAGQRETLAALIGGDLGPRLLPMGSLAGLLWVDSLRKLEIDVSPARFALFGAVVLVPTLGVSLLLLYVLT